MREILKGVLCAAIGVVVYKHVYNKGYYKGVEECNRMVKLAVDVQETVEKKNEES